MTRRPAQTHLTPSALALSALLACGLLPEDAASRTPLRWRETLRDNLPNRADYEHLELGYYEQLLDGSPTGRRAGSTSTSKGPAAENERLTLEVDDVREFVLKPNQVRDLARDVPWSTNALGMRDRDYPTVKPPATFRVALVGDSIGAGWGVDDDEGFEPRLERCWDERSRGAGGPAVEVLNFAVPGHGPGQRWTQFDTLGWKFAPDLVVYEATPADVGWDERRLRSALARGVGFDAPVYHDILMTSGIRPGLEAEAYRRLLRPLRWELLAGVYGKAAEQCRARGVRSAWVLVPRVGRPIDPADHRRLVELARRAGFDVVVDATDVYDGANPADLALGPKDFHPNAAGHARIARVLDAALGRLPALAGLWDHPKRDQAASRAGLDPHDRDHSRVRTPEPDSEPEPDRERAEHGRGADPR